MELGGSLVQSGGDARLSTDEGKAVVPKLITRDHHPVTSIRLGPHTRHATGLLQVPLCELQKTRPIRRGSMSSLVLPEAKVAIEQRGLDRRKLGGPQIFLSEQSINRASRDFC